MKKKWNIFPENKDLQKKLASELDVSAITAQVLINRGITSAEQGHFFYTSDLSHLHSPFLLKDMNLAVERIKRAIGQKERIMIYGDYDADGITSTALLFSALSKLGGDVVSYIPNRLDEGYGLSKQALKKAASDRVSLVVTVDCGITAVEEIEYANGLRIDVIVTDHHRLGDKLPPAFAIINSLQEDCRYPDKDLVGVGLAYKLSCALSGERGEEYLDLVALGTVADVAPLTGENRILVKEGLKRMLKNRVGLSALAKMAGLNKEISSANIAYILAPRINASGRLNSSQLALKLFLTSSLQEAENLAKLLNDENAKRQEIEKGILEQAVEKLSNIKVEDKKIIILSDERWHPGVVGIVASRLVGKYYRPVILFAIKDEKAKGSGRSIKKFHLFDALMQCKDIVDECGGHKYAVGLSLQKERIKEFTEKMERVAGDRLGEENLIASLNIDAQIPLSQLDFRLLDEIDKLSPFGAGNPKIVFVSEVELKSHQRLKNNHLKFWVNNGGNTYPALWFNGGENFGMLTSLQKFQIAYSPSVNTWNGKKEIQLIIKDVREMKK